MEDGSGKGRVWEVQVGCGSYSLYYREGMCGTGRLGVVHGGCGCYKEGVGGI
jgi:hypothetical protein